MRKMARVNTTKIDAAGMIAALVVSLSFTYVFVGGGLRRAGELRVEASALTEELDYLTELSETLAKGEQTLEALENNMRVLNERLPAEMDFQDFYRALNAKAKEDEVLISQVRPGEASEKEEYIEMPVSISATAEFERFHNFLFSISSLNRLTTLEHLSVRVSDQPHLCDIEMIVKIYAARSEETTRGS